MKTWVYAVIGGLAALVIVAGVGGYLLGVNAGRASANAVRNRFLASRTGGSAPGRLGLAAGNGGIVTIKEVRGNTLIVTTRDGEARVQLREGIRVLKFAEGAPGDLQPGMRILVIGQTDSAGNMTADTIQVVPEEGWPVLGSGAEGALSR